MNRQLDIRTISPEGIDIDFTATAAECDRVAERFDVSSVRDWTVRGRFTRGDMIAFDGEIRAAADRICGITLHPFTEQIQAPVHLLFAENPPADDDNPDEVILPIHRGKIDLFETFADEFGLNLNPFPKSVDTYLDYHDPDDTPVRENPFAVLQKLKKENP